MKVIIALAWLALNLAETYAGDLRSARIALEIAPENLLRLEEAPRDYVDCRFSADGKLIGRARIHLKGTGTFQPLHDKPNFTIKLIGSSWQELEKFHLNNSAQDPTYLRELIGARFFQAAGIPAPRVSHATVQLNGRPLGLYVLKEGFSDRFLENAFGSNAGALFEPRRGCDVDGSFERKAGQGEFEFAESAVNWDHFARFMALEVMLSHWDGYSLGKNNYRVLRKQDGTVSFLPSGMDQVFATAEMPWLPDPTGRLARTLVSSDEGRERYARTFKTLFARAFDTNQASRWIDAGLQTLRPLVSRRPFGELKVESERLREKIVARYNFLELDPTRSAPAMLRFENNVAIPREWQLYGGHEQSVAQAPLHLTTDGGSMRSWRSAVRLASGPYRFEAVVRTVGVQPRPLGSWSGATLRVHGTTRRAATLSGTSGPELLTTAIEVTAPHEDLLLICDLRASSGEAWFDEIRVVRELHGMSRAKKSGEGYKKE